MMLVNTVGRNFEGYTRHDIKRAKEARRIQGMIANPTEKLKRSLLEWCVTDF